MSNTLTLLDKTPDWIEALCREIDTLKFASAFDTFTPDAMSDVLSGIKVRPPGYGGRC